MSHKWKAVDSWGNKDQCERCSLIRYKQPFRNTRYFRAADNDAGQQRVFSSGETLKICTPVEVETSAIGHGKR